MKIEDGYYIVCPLCGEFSKGEGWTYYMKTVTKNSVEVGNGGFIYYDQKDILYSEDYQVEHKCGFYEEEASPEDYIVKVENGEVTCVSHYWMNNLEDLELLIKKNGYELKISDNLREC